MGNGIIYLYTWMNWLIFMVNLYVKFMGIPYMEYLYILYRG